MIKPRLLLAASLLIPSLYLAPILRADNAAPPATSATTADGTKSLVDVSAAGSESKFAADAQSNGQITLSHSASPAGVVVTVAPGTADYPGVSLKPEGGTPWNLSAFDHIEVTITNTGTDKLSIGVRVDDSGGWQDNNTEMGYLDPGETQTIKVTFGFSYGKPGFAVNTASLAQVLIMTDKTTASKTFRIESVKAAGTAAKK